MKPFRNLVLLWICTPFATSTFAQTLLSTNGPRELWAVPIAAPSDDFLAAEIVIRARYEQKKRND